MKISFDEMWEKISKYLKEWLKYTVFFIADKRWCNMQQQITN